jgi:lysophospholipase L1-like esterase
VRKSKIKAAAKSRRGTLGLVLALPALVAAGLGMAPVRAASAGPAATPVAGAEDTAVVMMGDSFVSGNAGRWQGNAADPNDLGDYWGTDRAAYNCHGNGAVCRHDSARVYGNTASTCFRSDSAEIKNADIPVAQHVNLACSGAQTVNVIRAGRGGQPNKGEAPQIDQLRTLLATTRVKMIVVTIGGNDLGFAGIIKSCIARYTVGVHCQDANEPAFAAGLEQVRPKIAEVVRQVANVMADAGYVPGSYRFVLQAYPSPIPTGAQYRYPQSGLQRIHTGHCPIYDSDSDWVHTSVVPRIADLFKDIAAQHHIEFLDLRNLLDGHEVCSRGARQPSRSNSLTDPLPGNESEWARFFDSQPQGNVDESVHPNYFGQLAMGSCLSALYAAPATQWNHRCANVSGKGPLHVRLTSTSLEN